MQSLDDLPLEILAQIIVSVYLNKIQISFAKHIEWFSKSVCLVNKKFYYLSTKYLVHYCRFARPQTFDIFNKYWLDKKIQGESIFKYVTVLDFQEFTSVGLGRTKRMNNEIQMVTKATIMSFLQRAENLIEFLSSENIQSDISPEILRQLFFKLHSLSAIDFCGSTGENFSSCFTTLVPEISQSSDFANLKNLSFHDCTDISDAFFAVFLPRLTNVEKLDLYHTKVSGDSLCGLSASCNLTHLSIGNCYQINKVRLLRMFKYHPAVKERLKWLSIETDGVNDLSDKELLILLKCLVPNINYNLQYLNMNGRTITNAVLTYIKTNFVFLKSLNIQNSDISLDDLIDFLAPPKSNALKTDLRLSMLSLNDYYNNQKRSKYVQLRDIKEFNETKIFQQLRFINVKGNTNISNGWSLNNPGLIEACPSLLAWEFDSKVLDASSFNSFNYSTDNFFWKIFQASGRRSWLYKLRSYNVENSKYLNFFFNLDLDYNSFSSDEIDYEILTDDPNYVPNATFYDMETGKKIEPRMIFYPFLKYASKKIDMSNGPFYSGDSDLYKIWPVKFSERGIYKYYALNV